VKCWPVHTDSLLQPSHLCDAMASGGVHADALPDDP